MRDIEDDMDCVDGAEDLYVTQAGSTEEVEVLGALRRQVRVLEVEASDGAYTAEDVVFNVAAKRFDRRPKPGSVVTTHDREESFTLHNVDIAALRTRYRLWCKRVPEFDEDDERTELVTVEAASFLRNADGVLTPTWTMVDERRVHIQPLTTETVVEVNRRRVRVDGRVVFGDGTGVEAGQRIRTADGTVWHLHRTTGTGQIGRLLVADVELARSPQGG